MPTPSRRSSRSASTTTTLRSPKPAAWSGSTKTTPVKAKNGVSATLSYVFAEPEMTNLGDSVGAMTTLSSSIAVGKTISEDQNIPNGQNNGQSSIPASPTPVKKSTWYGSISRSRTRKPTQLLHVEGPQQDPENTEPRMNIAIPLSTTPPPIENIFSRSPPATQEVQAPVAEQTSQESLILPTAVQNTGFTPPTSPPNKRRWFSSVNPAVGPTMTDVNLDRDVSTKPGPAASVISDFTPATTLSGSPSSLKILPPSPSRESPLPEAKPQAVKSTTSTPPALKPVAPKRSWFSSTKHVEAAAVSDLPSSTSSSSAPVVELALSMVTPPPPAPTPVFPAPPDVASVTEKVNITPPASPGPTQPTVSPLPLPPSKRGWFSTYKPAPASVASFPTSEATPPQSSHSHSIPSSLDDDVPALSTLPFPLPVSGSDPGLSVAPITPAPSFVEHPVSSSPISSPTLSNSSSTSSKNTAQPGSRPRLSSLSSLNPSTSRFTLSIPLPLLGPTKIPLPMSRKEEPKEVVETTTMEVASTNPITTVPTTTTTNSELSRTSVPPTSPTKSSSSTDQTSAPASTETLEQVKPEQTTIAPSTSWWSYVGWTAASVSTPTSSGDPVSVSNEDVYRADPATGPDAKHVKDVNSTAVTTTPTATTSVPPLSSLSPAQTKDMTEGEKDNKVTNSATSKDMKVVESAISTVPKEIPEPVNPLPDATSDANSIINPSTIVKTSDTASVNSQGTSGQMWYSPWAWYGSTGTKSTTNELEGGKDTEVKSDADLVKEATIAGEKFITPLTDPEQPKSEPTIQELNPVEKSFETHRGGWAAFFSSRALGIKLIKGPGDVERDENGMETMEIDFGEDDAQGTTSTTDRNGGDTATQNPTIGNVGQDKESDDTRGRMGMKRTKAAIAVPPLTISNSVKKDVEKVVSKKGSPAASVNNVPSVIKDVPKKESQSNTKDHVQAVAKRGSTSAPTTRSPTPGPGTRTQVPNLVLPTWADTFHTAPRNLVPPPPETTFGKTMKFVSGVLFAAEKDKGRNAQKGITGKGKGRMVDEEFVLFGKGLPRAWDVLEDNEMKGKGKGKGGSVGLDADVLRGCKRVVVIGIHGWFPGAVVRTVLGEPTGTSAKFVNMMVQALEEFELAHGVKLEKITKIPLEGEGTISGRVKRLYANLQANAEWMGDLHNADAIIVATHSQGSIVSTHLLDRLIQDGHITTKRGANPVSTTASDGPGPLDSFSAPGIEALASVGANALATSGLSINTTGRKPQKICCLALCGIHLGPLRYLSSSSLFLPYIQYFESTAAKELFEFQNTESDVSKEYVKALTRVVDQGTKMVYVASLNDQVVPIYSGLFTAVSHPLILRALYIDGDAYHSSDFLSNLLVLLLRILNSGISDSGLLAHLSEATAGSLNGVGHSTAYEEISTYALAVKYLFLTDDGLDDHPELMLEPFNANSEQNDYEIPWSLRDVIADEHVAHFFGSEISQLRDAFKEWHPKTTILRDLKRKLQPIQKLPSTFTSDFLSSSKL